MVKAPVLGCRRLGKELVKTAKTARRYAQSHESTSLPVSDGP